MDVSEAVVAALELEGEFGVVQTEAMEDGGVEVMDVDGVLGDVVTEVIGGAEGEAGLDAAAGHPDGEAAGVVVTAVFGGREGAWQ